MRVLTVSGRIVADAQKQISQQGREFMTFRLANNEFGDPKDEQGNPKTRWFRVSCFNPAHMGMCKFLTKGKPINVIGKHNVSLYNGQISEDIVADIITFVEGNQQNNNGDTNNSAQVAQTAPAVTVPVEMPKVTASAPQSKSTTATVQDASDDLPF